MFQIGVQLGGLGDNGRTLLEQYELVKEAGFDAVDANVDHLFPAAEVRAHNIWPAFKPGISDTETLEYFRPWKEASKATGIPNYQAHAPFPPLVYDDGDMTYNDFLLEVMRKSIIGCDFIDCRNLVIHPFDYRYPNMTSFQEGWDRNVERYLYLAKTAKEYGVTICIENMNTHDGPINYVALTNQPDRAARLVDTLNDLAGAKVFGFCLDIGHAVLGSQDPQDFLETLGDRLTCLHVHDNDGVGDQHLAPGMGGIDWNHVIAGLKHIHYDKTLCFETFRMHHKLDALGALPEALKTLAKIGREFARKASES